MSMHEIQSKIAKDLRREGELTLRAKNDAELALKLGARVGVISGSEDMASVLMEQSLRLLQDGPLTIVKEGETVHLTYVPQPETVPGPETRKPHDAILGELGGAYMRLEQLEAILKFESDPEGSDTQSQIKAAQNEIEKILARP